MSTSIQKIEKEFNRIKGLGFIKSNRVHNTGIGKTFEDYLGVKENNIKDADFDGFEVKSQRELSASYITLFTKSPSSPTGANAYLKDAFGRGDAKFPHLKALHTSSFGDSWNTVHETYDMKLSVNRDCKNISLIIKEFSSELVLSDNIHWSFDDLRTGLNKMKSLFVVTAETEKRKDGEYFHYTKAKVYHNVLFDKFLELLEEGFIQFDIRIGVYKTGKAIGKPHDHGSAFRIKKENIHQIYEEVIEIN